MSYSLLFRPYNFIGKLNCPYFNVRVHSFLSKLGLLTFKVCAKADTSVSFFVNISMCTYIFLLKAYMS